MIYPSSWPASIHLLSQNPTVHLVYLSMVVTVSPDWQLPGAPIMLLDTYPMIVTLVWCTSPDRNGVWVVWKTTEAKSQFYCIIPSDTFYDHEEQVSSYDRRLLYFCPVKFPPFYTVWYGRKSLCQAHLWTEYVRCYFTHYLLQTWSHTL